MRSVTASAIAAFAIASAACGPYADVAQKLDVTKPFDHAETWVAAQGTDVRVLVLGTPSGGTAGFAITTLQTPVSAGTSSTALQGDWSEDASAGAASFVSRLEYRLPDERGRSMLARTGVTRSEVDRDVRVGFVRSPGRLTITGDATFSGIYRPLPQALASLGTATERDAACAFQVLNLAIRAIHTRIIGFGGPGMTQYQNAATYASTLSGSTRVEMSGYLHNRTTITFGQAVELNGIRFDGPETTEANSSGDGQMSGVLAFTFEPASAEGGALATIGGTLDYGGAGDPADALQIRSGTPVGGHYAMALDGGGRARVSPETAPSPSVPECLDLP